MPNPRATKTTQQTLRKGSGGVSLGGDDSVSMNISELQGSIENMKSKIDTMITKEDLKELIDEMLNNMSDRNEMESVRNAVCELSEKYEHVVKSVEELKKENCDLKNIVKELESDIALSDVRSKEAMCISNYNEQYSRKNNVKLLGVPEENGETLLEKIPSMINNICNIICLKTDVVAVHRLPSRFRDKPRPIIVKFKNSDLKRSVMIHKKKFYDNRFMIFDDVTIKNQGLINRLKSKECVESSWYYNGHVYAKMRGKKGVKIDLFDIDVEEKLGKAPNMQSESYRRH